MIRRAIAALALGAAAAAAPAFAAQVLNAQTNLLPGEYLSTRSGLYTLVMQSDGNLVQYFNPPYPYTGGISKFVVHTQKGHHLSMQMDGNLAIYTSGNTWAWTSGTGGKPYNMGYKLVLFETGRIAILDAGGGIVKELQEPVVSPRDGGPVALFPFRTYANGQCVDSLTPPMKGGWDANYWAWHNGGAIGYCGNLY
jgi:hypothetical protein